MPTPRQGETEQQFVSRCVPFVIEEGTAESEEQAAAMCHSMFRDHQNVKSHNFKVNFASEIRREEMDGHTYMVFPAIVAQEGVMNGAFVSADELGAYTEAWNGRPVPILHPEEQGIPISAASRPDIFSRSVGWVMNTRMEGEQLKAELWIDEMKADRLGASELISSMANGEMVEISTGYFADTMLKAGTHGGKSYDVQHVNIRPDHIAILPGEIGACSIEDGCGVPRVHNKRTTGVKVNEAIKVLLSHVGFKGNGGCACGGNHMTKEELLKRAKKLHANKAITAEQLEMLQGFDDEQAAMAGAILDALVNERAAEMQESEYETGNEPGDVTPVPAAQTRGDGKSNGKPKSNGADAKPKSNGAEDGGTRPMTQEQIAELVANTTRETIRRERVMEELTTNSKCPFSEDELQGMQLEHLEKLAKSIRPANYEGAAGFASNANYDEGGGDPLPLSPGVLTSQESAAGKEE